MSEVGIRYSEKRSVDLPNGIRAIPAEIHFHPGTELEAAYLQKVGSIMILPGGNGDFCIINGMAPTDHDHLENISERVYGSDAQTLFALVFLLPKEDIPEIHSNGQAK